MQQQQKQQQQQQPQRRRRRRRAMILLMFLTLSSTIDSSYGWMSNSNTIALPTSTTTTTTTTSTSTSTSAFYKTSSSSTTVLTDDFLSVTFPPPIKIKRGPTINIKKEFSKTINQQYIKGSKLPWINNNDVHNDKENDNDNENDDNVYLSHWDWQLSYFKEHLSNFRINEEAQETDCSDLMYIEQKQQRVYTVSYKSDEYRDIRMTYMHFPGSQCFRCICYPNSSNVPILGMAYMNFGGNSNMAIMDYQPLPTTTTTTTTTAAGSSNDKYESELLRIRSEIPSMNSPMSKKHFDDTKEERTYFTDYPLISKWTDNDNENENENDDDDDDDDDSAEFYHKELIRAQKDYVKTHIKLTKEEMNNNKNNDRDHDHDNDNVDILKLHSDFDTFVSSKEPAGKILCGTFGKEIGNQLVHRIIFPLSRNL